jgi:formylmethanofuran dehydrogenase subunit B
MKLSKCCHSRVSVNESIIITPMNGEPHPACYCTKCGLPCDTIETKEEKEETIEHLVTVIGTLAHGKDGDDEWFSKKSFKEAVAYTDEFIEELLTQQKEAIEKEQEDLSRADLYAKGYADGAKETEKEWQRKNAELLESLADMYDQYCGEESGHSFMSAGEQALTILQEYGVILGENGMGGEGKIDYEKITKLLQ